MSARLMRQSGAKLEEIQEALGHKNINNTRVYLRTTQRRRITDVENEVEPWWAAKIRGIDPARSALWESLLLFTVRIPNSEKLAEPCEDRER